MHQQFQSMNKKYLILSSFLGLSTLLGTDVFALGNGNGNTLGNGNGNAGGLAGTTWKLDGNSGLQVG